MKLNILIILILFTPFLAFSQDGVKSVSTWIEGTDFGDPNKQVFKSCDHVHLKGESSVNTRWRASVYQQGGGRVLYVKEMTDKDLDFAFKLPTGKYVIEIKVNPRGMKSFSKREVVETI